MSTAVELLRKGGTLASESCSVCRGVQVKFLGKIICVNCGREQSIGVTETGKKKSDNEEVLSSLKTIVLSRISELLPVLKSEKDLANQAQVVQLIKHYLEVLEKIPKDNKSKQ